MPQILKEDIVFLSLTDMFKGTSKDLVDAGLDLAEIFLFYF